MTVEAALLGRPAVSCFPGEKPLYIKYLEKERLVETIRSPKKIAAKISRVLESEDERAKQEIRGRALLRRMEDPVKVISEAVRRTWQKPRS